MVMGPTRKGDHGAMMFLSKGRTLLLLFSLFGVCLKGFAQERVTLTNGSWPPYLGPSLSQGGTLTQIVTEAFALGGYQARYIYLPWNRSYVMAQRGTYDGTIGWAATPEREKDFYFTQPVITVHKVFFHLKSFNFTWHNMHDLKGLRVGATTHYTYGPDFDRAVQDGEIKVDYVTADRLNIVKLLAGRIDVFPMSLAVGEYWIHHLLSPSQAALITYNPKPITTTHIAVAISRRLSPKRAHALVKAFNMGLAKMKADGQLEKLALAPALIYNPAPKPAKVYPPGKALPFVLQEKQKH